MVLLKNEDGILPLDRNERIAVLGAFAKKPRFQGGGSSHINCYRTSNLMEALGDIPSVTYCDGYSTDRNTIDEELLNEAAAAAKSADKVVIVAGLPDAFESEGYDRTHLNLPDCHNELIQRVSLANPNTAVVLYNGSPVLMPWLSSVKGLIEAYLPGENAGYATRDVLFGDVDASGRLPETFPLRLEDTPCYITYGSEKDNAEYTEGVFVGIAGMINAGWTCSSRSDTVYPIRSSSGRISRWINRSSPIRTH